jgi:hypothetical protein
MRIEDVYLRKEIGVTDCELVYESAFLNAVARFEGLLNVLLQEFVCGTPSRYNGCFSLVVPRSRTTFRTILAGGRAYVDLMPYKDCIEIAKRYLNSGKPFSDVDSSDREILSKAVLIRNAIAHRSSVALEKFRKDVNGVNLIPAHRQFPGTYLRRVYRSYPTETWSDLYFDTLEKVGARLASSW